MRLISRDTMYYSLHYSVSNVQKLMDCFSFSRYKAFVLHLDIHYYVYIYRKYHVFKKGNLIYNLERRQQKKSCSQKCNSDQATTRVKSASFASQTVSSSQGQPKYSYERVTVPVPERKSISSSLANRVVIFDFLQKY